jgi:hypothetical protein
MFNTKNANLGLMVTIWGGFQSFIADEITFSGHNSPPITQPGSVDLSSDIHDQVCAYGDLHNLTSGNLT